jgi:RNA polymerase sigma factor (sigma-70 family)
MQAPATSFSDETKGGFLYRRYNQSREMVERESRFDPEFWEIRVDPETLSRFASSDQLHYESEDDVQGRQERAEWVLRTFPVIDTLIDEVLTRRQNQIVRMYFLDQMTEPEIAGKLGISTASISQHLFGKMRSGKRVGGAIPKLRKKIRDVGSPGPRHSEV